MDRGDHDSSTMIAAEGHFVPVPNKTCETCGRCFARNEHLIRHRRTHTMGRPFHCAHCNVEFARSDVRERHMKRFHPEEGGAGAVSSSSSLSLPQLSSSAAEKRHRPHERERERSKLACDQCRKRKLKCNNTRPCDSCRTKMLLCTISGSSRPAGRPPNRVSVSSVAAPVQVPVPVPLEQEATASTLSSSLAGPWAPGGLEPSPLDTPGSFMPRIADGSVLGIADVTPRLPSVVGISPTGMSQGVAEIVNSTETTIPCDPYPLDQIWQEVHMMDELLPQVYLGNWFGDLDEFSTIDDLGSLDFLTSDIDSNSSTANAIYIMEEYFQRRSRESSLSGEEPNHRAWFSAPPQLYIYDEEVINILLNLARTHISSSFAIFSDFEVTPETPVELCLAMSAVGGLYCSAEGGTKVAKKLFNDSRRMFLEYNLPKSSSTFEESLSFAKTFILLEIYGLCGGDKRAFEFVEVFHASKVHAVSSCLKSLPQNAPPDRCREVKLLLEAMQVLDSYRVLLLQHPPSFAPEQHLRSHGSNEMSKRQRISTDGLISLLSPGSTVEKSAVGMHHLTTIISYGWMASLQDLESFSYPTLWKPEFVELSLNRWIQAKGSRSETCRPSEVPQMLLFHLAHVSLHANLRKLQRLTQEAVRSGQQSQKRGILDSIRAWRNSRHFNIAHWHAITILGIAQEAMTPRSQYQLFERDKLQFVEPPHLPFCIYFASLIAWSGAVALSGDPRSGDGAIEEGSQLLFRLKVHVSKQLGAALCELRSNGTQGVPPDS